MSRGREMRANLVRAACVRPRFDHCEIPKRQQGTPIGLRGAALPEPGCHPCAPLWIPRDRPIDGPVIARHSPVK
jgi:hypothetical protein